VAPEPKLIAAGRASEIFDLGDGRVLRRFKRGGDSQREALVMGHARRHGYPVPEVLDVTADALVLERIEGKTMWEAAAERPSAVDELAGVLARLHRELHEICAPVGLPAVVPGDRLLHLDLHPQNVILGAVGRSFLVHFLPHFDRAQVRSALRAAAEYRLADANVTDAERRAIRQLVARERV
jgi:Ser/Thr protein kinase RdoA (MazF antagonist)